MTAYSITTTAQAVASAGDTWQFTHSSGTANVFLENGTRAEVLAPGGAISLSGAWTARTTSGTATVDVLPYRPAWEGSQSSDVVSGVVPSFRTWVSGRYYGAMPHTPGAAASSLLLATPFWVPAALTIAAIACEVTTAGAGSAVRLGIYASDATDTPSAVLLDAGTVDSSTTGVKEITVSQTIPAGLVWLAAVSQGGTNPQLRNVGSGSLTPVAPTSFIGASGAVGMSCYFMSGVTGALPAWSGSNPASAGHLVKVKAA